MLFCFNNVVSLILNSICSVTNKIKLKQIVVPYREFITGLYLYRMNKIL